MNRDKNAPALRNRVAQTKGATRSTALLATALCLASFSGMAVSATFEWVNGRVTSFTAQLPMFTVAIINSKGVRFCEPTSGADYAVTADNIHYDMLKASFINKKKVQVGVQNFGNDPQSGSVKLCIDRVLLTN